MSLTLPANININPSSVNVEELIATRTGDVLIKQTLLKADHFPGCQNVKLRPLLDGAPNFRKVDGLNVYGVAIPTVAGLRNVLNEIGAAGGRRKVFWNNMREEPVIYINGQPYVVREADQPFCNLEYTGIDRSRVEDMEQRLKLDILKEARLYHNQILVAHENENMQVINVWESVTPEDVQTPLEVYAELKEDGYDVDYIRVPVTDEKAPKDGDFDLLIKRLWNTPPSAALFFNCQMGRGRTTTGMIIAAMLMLRRMGAFPVNGQVSADVPEWFTSFVKNELDSTENELSSGMYGVVRSLLRALERGSSGKRVLDAVINACSAMQNLRTAIATYRSRIISESIERKRNVMMAVALEYLERYYVLIAFAAYLNSPLFSPGSSKHINYAEWTAARPELRSILIRMLRRNPVNALELNAPGSTLETQDQYSEIVENRTGAVLGPHTILKEDLFPGMQSPKVPSLFQGAPNFRGVEGLGVYGVGMSTVDGMRSVLKFVMTSATNTENQQTKVLWFNMREEAVVYIGGKPFVLREQLRPLKNMQEYGGITASRLENMEARLKADVLAEAARNGGRILVTCESCSQGSTARALQEDWIEVGSPEMVKTPKEVYNMLVREGFNLVYTRVPVTDGTSPQAVDFDAILQAMSSPDCASCPVVFNCQLGVGRTTTGMVTACLVRLFSGSGSGHTGNMPRNFLRSPHSNSHLDLTKLEHSDSLFNLSWAIHNALSSAASAQLQGCSPASDSESNDGDKGDSDEAPEDAEEEERMSMAQGHYVGVRRIARLLEEGDLAKKLVDNVIDACSKLVNLRLAIVKCCHRLGYRNMKPEMRQRHVNFARGASYLERYCVLITLSSYLQRGGLSVNGPFSEWVNSRTHLVEALQSLHKNPAAALAAVPSSSINELYGVQTDVGLQEQHSVLAKRRGRTLSKRTILKTYEHVDHDPEFPLFPDLRQVDHLPVFTVGNISVEGLSRLLTHLGAGPTGRSHVIMCDVREEPVLYVNGNPYIRRELEMPAAALHHAGIHWAQLEELEAAMREDVANELSKFGGRILLHREVPRAATPPEMSPACLSPILTAGSNKAAVDSSTFSSFAAISAAAEKLGEDVDVLERAAKRHKEDVTTVVDSQPGNAVVAFWEPSTGRVDATNGMCTARQVHQLLAAEGMQVSYRRIPLSRERTPVPQDLSDLYTQIIRKPFSSDRHTVYLILARKSTGSSARFVSSAISMYLTRYDPPVPTLRKATTDSLGEYRGVMALCRLLPQGTECKQAADAAINRCNQIGNLREDIVTCKRIVDACPQMQSDNPATPAFAARQLGLHYLKRYFLLICFRHYIKQANTPSSPERSEQELPTFTAWMDSRKELSHLLNHLTLATTS